MSTVLSLRRHHGEKKMASHSLREDSKAFNVDLQVSRHYFIGERTQKYLFSLSTPPKS
jgi:hypothetical protein